MKLPSSGHFVCEHKLLDSVEWFFKRMIKNEMKETGASHWGTKNLEGASKRVIAQ